MDEKTGIRTLTFNRPKRLNALNGALYAALPSALAEAADDPATKITVLTGAGDYYSSGNDLLDFASTWATAESSKEAAEMSALVLRNFVASFIDFPKVLVAAVNGPAFGIAATSLPLCDAVFMSTSAYIRTPFASLFQSPEGCSSYTFPRIMGPVMANEMLLFDRQISAQQAKSCGLATEVFEESDFRRLSQERIKDMAQFLPASLSTIKGLVRGHETDILHQVNEKECKLLVKLWQSKECAEGLARFAAKHKH